MRKGNTKLTISINEDIKEEYKSYCDAEGLQLGKQIEKFMQHELEKKKK
ncbi:hypothetical protein HY491_03325 [Candidatus Woesearchaeota archaeon]|nr:hypothetical protein [Candidatus Woesearchaeota archaeon]